MKVLLDHNVPHGLRHLFPDGCEVYTAHYMGWADRENGALMEAAEEAAFAVIVTLDQGIAYQQALETYSIGIIFLRARPADLPHLEALMPEVIEALPAAAAGRHVTVFA